MEFHSKLVRRRGSADAANVIPIGRTLALLMIAATGIAMRGPSAAAQTPLEIRFQSPSRGEIVARFADGVLTSEGESDFSSGKWWTGIYSAKLSDLDLETVNYGTFTEPGSPAAATLSCKASDNCVSKKGKWTLIKCDAEVCNKNVDPNGTDRSIDIWCESVAKCQAFVKTLKETLAKSAQ